MPFDYGVFIKPDIEFKREFSLNDNAPMFRKKFTQGSFCDAKLRICGLGIAYCWINGKKVTEDLFTAPVSNYCKTLWYNEYDVTNFLQEGENTIAVICGNGWYNESLITDWRFDIAPWRDLPKFIARIETDGKTALVTDSSWKCKPDSAVFFNQLRSGEYFDANLWDETWVNPDFDDSSWENAARDVIPPTGSFRLCECEPIREHEMYSPVSSWQVSDKKDVFDVGHNVSGYIRLTAKGKKGEVITIRYAESISESGNFEYYGMDTYGKRRGNHPFATDKFICSGKKLTWSPMFAYHGFRYVELDGIESADEVDVEQVFVHQAVERRTSFKCSDDFLNKIFEFGIGSSWSNMFYALTDCPTREKLGWCNDAQSSAEQLITNFKIENFYEKWHRDIKDAVLSDGSLPGIVPTSGWGYHWGNGPVSDGILFELPYRVYLHTGDSSLLVSSLGYFDKYFGNLDRNKNSEGFVSYGLDDWAAPGNIHIVEPEFINAVLEYNFANIALLASECANNGDGEKYKTRAKTLEKLIKEKYIAPDGRCTINEQCSVAMLVYYGLYDDIEPLAKQLAETVESTDYHIKCGMVGIRRLLHALSMVGKSDIAYKLLTQSGYPGYKHWYDLGAVSLWEKWDANVNSDSKNHHMYSDYMSWMIKTLAGIKINENKCGELEFLLDPHFIPQIDWVDFDYDTVCGKISVNWRRENGIITLNVYHDSDVKLIYNGELLKEKENKFIIQGECRK